MIALDKTHTDAAKFNKMVYEYMRGVTDTDYKLFLSHSKCDKNKPVIVPKNQFVYHTTGKNPSEFKLSKEGYLYCVFDYIDRMYYAGFFATMKYKNNLKYNQDPKVYLVEFKLKTDIRTLSYNEQLKEWIKFYGENKKLVANELSQVSAYIMDEKPNMLYNELINATNKDLSDYWYYLFIGSFERIFRKFSMYDMFRKQIKSKGANSLIDANDVNESEAQSRYPIIILDTIETLGHYTMRELTKEEIINNMDEWIKLQQDSRPDIWYNK